MTRAIAIPQTEATAKVRATWLVAVLSLVTLGIYQIYWWFAINRELRDLGRSRGVDLGRRPALSALAVSVGSWVVVPYVWTVIATSGRIAEAERMAGLTTTHKVWLASSLLIASMALSMAACLLASSGVGLAGVMVNLGAVVYLQDALNRVWTQVGSRHSAPPAQAVATA